jgi:ribosomal peptide maturation radical SAM protein 1
MTPQEQEATGSRRVLLISMPWARPERPSLGLGTLKAVLARDGLAADILYLNTALARRMGLRLYTFFALFGYRTFRSEVFFTPHGFGLDAREYVERTLKPHVAPYYPEITALAPRLFGSEEDFLRSCEEIVLEHIPAFLREAEEAVPWERYDVVGFSLMFEQTLASVALASRLRARRPETRIVFGGPSCEGEMGEEMLRSFACIDVVALGEADQSVVPLVSALRGDGPLARVPGIAYRGEGGARQTPPPPLLQDLDWLPVPDFGDFQAASETLPGLRQKIFFETSRGCWWGQKSLCTFCGLNGNGLAFRRKSPDRVIAELLELEARYGVRQFAASDNILDHSYYQSVLPRLRELNEGRPPGERLSIFYEIKTPVRREQVELLVRAGIDTVQPGIETFSDAVLARMRKGTTAIQQIQFIRWASELGLTLYYGLIHSNPQDEPEDYEEILRAIGFIEHLPPPNYVTPLALDRFSPYYLAPASHGISNIRPGGQYEVMFPDARVDRAKIAYTFDFDHELHGNAPLQDAIHRLCERVGRWRQSFQPGSLTWTAHGEGICVHDRRGGEEKTVELEGPAAAVFSFCGEYRGRALIASQFASLPERQLDGILGDLTDRRLLFRDPRDRFLSLPVASAAC